MNNPMQRNDRTSFPTKRLISAHEDADFVLKKNEQEWHKIINRLPSGLRAALLAELKLGNCVTSLDMDWPQTGSIVITLGSSFKFKFAKSKLGVKYSKTNDSHYWRRDVSQTVDGVDYLMIC